MAISSAQTSARIEYAGKTPEGLVGNGRSVVRVLPTGFTFHSGGNATGELRFFVKGKLFVVDPRNTHAEFFPGGVKYTLSSPDVKVEILYGATPENPFFVVIRAQGKVKSVDVEVNANGMPAIVPSGRMPVHLKKGVGQIIFSSNAVLPNGTVKEIQQRLESPYQKEFILHTPSSLVNRAVPFNRYLLDLGFDGNLHVCEIFRWRDVWSRDLGSGLVPGAMSAGQFSAARTTIEYDLRRYERNNPRGLKATEDPSQGGSAEGTSWLARAVWRYYLFTGDTSMLKNAERILRPWVNAWIDRDANESGLLVDVTEWMDHSRFFLFPDGSRILYSNALFVDLLETFSKIEQTLGDNTASQRLEEVRTRFLRGINAVLWNEATGEYDNLSLWGKRDTRSSSAENALAILCNVVPAERTPKILDAVKKNNWRAAGSTTIFPPMTHVDISIDHNYKMWPWWNAVEAKARLLNGDIEGGIHLLECCSKTLEDEHFPGLMEELTTPEGVTEGGNAFLTAAGSYQDAIVEGLLGIEILEPACARIRISPNTPKQWSNWNATVPLPEGEIILQQSKGKLRIRVTDPRVKTVEAPVGAIVEGAGREEVAVRTHPALANWSVPKPLEAPALRSRKAALFYDRNIPSTSMEGLPQRRISIDELLTLDSSNIDALIIAGNALPGKTQKGVEIQSALARFLDRGGALVFFGATMHERGTMGETGGLIDWYEYRGGFNFRPLTQWKFRSSGDAPSVKREHEKGMVNNWRKNEVSDSAWESIKVPQAWEEHFGSPFDGWGWYRVHFELPAAARGKTVVLDLGRIDDEDWTFVNGILAGTQGGWQSQRRYVLKPGTAVYEALNFGSDNILAVQVYDGGGGGGLYADSARVGIETDDFAWRPINPFNTMTVEQPVRFGVVSWGKGDFFNSWETSRGAFGFKVDGKGVEFTDVLSGISSIDVPVYEAFTDFAIAKPLYFQPLAFTTTQRKLLIPDNGERYPCLARIVNTQTGGEFILIPASITKTPAGVEVLKKLKIE
ncbi:MAG: trehalase family glycosidase [Bacteroidota bacterium]